jgi:phosphoglycerol transferase MdoB-like AlkP superfamily enzyme
MNIQRNELKTMLYQCGFLLLFVLFLYFNEQVTLHVLQAGNSVPFYTPETQAQLTQKAPLFLPGAYWLMVISLFSVAFVLFLPRRIRFIALYLLGAAYLLLLIGNELYYQFFSTAITLGSFKAMNQLSDVSSSVFAALKATQYGRLFGYLVVFAVPIVMFRKKEKLSKIWLYSDLLLGFFLALLSVRIFLIVEKTTELEGIERKANTILLPGFATSKRDFAITFGAGNLILDELVTRPDYDEKTPLSHSEADFVMNTFHQRFLMNEKTSPFFGIARDRNIVLISMESFQQFLVNLKLGDWEVCPNLNKLANEGMNFRYVFDNIVRGGSSDAEFMAMSGLLADVYKISVFEYPQTMSLLFLPESLREVGYDTASYHGNSGDFYDRVHNHPVYGFNHSSFIQSYSPEYFHMGVADKTFFLETAEKMNTLKQPFLSYLITLSSHHPFYSPPGTEDIDTGFPPDSEVTHYLHSVYYADQALGLFLDKMKEEHLYENSVFVIFGDHIPPMSQESRDLIANVLGPNPGDPQEMRIAFSILIPGMEQWSQEAFVPFQNTFGGLQDLYPTILHLIGVKAPFGLFGAHLFRTPDEKGPELFWRIQTGFGYEGRLYECDSSECQPVFVYQEDYEALSGSDAFVASLVAKDYFYLHRYIYEKNAQEFAREAYRYSTSEGEGRKH